jgi:quinol monooxygenase YgiN
MELFIFARFHAKAGSEDAAAAAIGEVVPRSRGEPGCVSIAAYRSAKDPRLFWIHSCWTDEAAFERHATLPHTVRFIATMRGLIDHELDIDRSRPLA